MMDENKYGFPYGGSPYPRSNGGYPPQYPPQQRAPYPPVQQPQQGQMPGQGMDKMLEGTQILTGEGFKPLSRQEREEAARIAAEANFSFMTLCPEEESILLNKNVLDHLEQPRQVQILINEEQGMLLLKACSVEDREAVVIPQLPPDQLEVSGASLLKRIRRLMGWNDNCPRQIMGFAIPEHDAIAFDLQNAVPVQLKPSGGGLPGRRS